MVKGKGTEYDQEAERKYECVCPSEALIWESDKLNLPPYCWEDRIQRK